MTVRQQLLGAARKGDANAQYELACHYDFTPPKDRRRAVRWYRRAAEQGHVEAQNLLGECIRDGIGVPQSHRAAATWFRSAADQGDASAQVSLGYALYYGQGVKRNSEEALRWYRKAARHRHSSAELNIGHMYRRGDVVSQSWQRAIFWYRKSAEPNILRPDGNGEGNLGAMHWLARIYGGLEDFPKRVDEAFRWCQRAAELGDPQSQCHLGVHYMNGVGIDRDPTEAAKWYRRAAESGDEWACYLIGLCYRDGDGVPRNRRWARHWFVKADRLGVREARDALQKVEHSASSG